ncbi:MAG: hypothetical protein PHQ75_07560 [Thermoguttaceae bacterium]|nr:hypothetical protein [Thermoguttaceae bacterium]
MKRTMLRLLLGIACAMFVCAATSDQAWAQKKTKKQLAQEAAAQKAKETREATLLFKSGLTQRPDLMMETWLLAEIDKAQDKWNARYESIKTVEDAQAYQKSHIDFFWKQLGQLWDKTPLNAKITGVLNRDSYRVEKVVFESLPKFYATGTMFLPLESRFKPPYPGVLVVCGHSFNGKGSDFYQQGCILAAQHGLAAFILDPIDQGERKQHLDEKGKVYSATVPAHNLVGSGSILLGRNTATFEIWDMQRGIDYLQSRKDVIADKIGVMGNSGGGTQTAYIMALDERVVAAAPACYICNLFDTLTHVNGPQDAEQNIFGQLAFGMDHADYMIMRAPRPTMLCLATKDMFNIDDAWKSFRFAKRFYGRFGFGERMSAVETDTPHGWYPQLREGGVRWMLRWLAGRDEVVVTDPNTKHLTDEEIASVPAPGVLALPGARTTYDLNRDLAKVLTPKRNALWSKMKPADAADLLRKTAVIRPLKDIPAIAEHKVDGVKDETILESDKGIYLPARIAVKDGCKEITLVISDSGRNGEFAKKVFADQSKSAVAVDLRGWGDSLQFEGRPYYIHTNFGPDGSDYYLAYLLGRTYVGMRTDDLFAVARYLKEKYHADLNLVADGYARTVALHAAIVEPQLFKSVTIDDPNSIETWNSLIEKSPCPIRLTDTIHGVLNYYDLDNLVKFINKK